MKALTEQDLEIESNEKQESNYQASPTERKNWKIK